jgi:AbrB family looped-hinge helix DNA binding protein
LKKHDILNETLIYHFLLFLQVRRYNMGQKIMEIKTTTITEKGQICLPQKARQMAGFKEGSRIGIIVYEDRVELRSMKQISEKLFPALATEEVLAEAWDTKEEDEAWKDL